MSFYNTMNMNMTFGMLGKCYEACPTSGSPQTDLKHQKKMRKIHQDLIDTVSKIKWWAVHYSLRKSEEKWESDAQEWRTRSEFENLMAQFFDSFIIDQDQEQTNAMSGYDDWMDDKTVALRCTRWNKKPVILRVSKTRVSQRISLLAKRKETQKTTTRIRDGGRREKNSVN